MYCVEKNTFSDKAFRNSLELIKPATGLTLNPVFSVRYYEISFNWGIFSYVNNPFFSISSPASMYSLQAF